MRPARAAGSGPAEAYEPLRPAELPPGTWDFTGRGEDVRFLEDMLREASACEGSGAVQVAIITGMAGAGKTALAVQAAHLAAPWFPDGQLFTDLHGATAEPLEPAEVLARFLRGLGVRNSEIPPGETERSALFRTVLTGRKVLIVLDNARDTAQVRPLLPGSSSCAVLVTARSRVPDLPGARVCLGALGDDEARTLFGGIVGAGRMAAEPGAAAEVLLACAGLPLAIRAAAAQLAVRQGWTIAAMADRMRGQRDRLDWMNAGELSVRASFQASLDSLPADGDGVDPARAFCLLAHWQEPVISLAAAAAFLGLAEGHADGILECLVDAHLLESPGPGEYEMHGLLRAYAAERAESGLPARERLAAVRRLLDWRDRAQAGPASGQHQDIIGPPDEGPATPLSLARPPGQEQEAFQASLHALLATHGITGREQAAAALAAAAQALPAARGPGVHPQGPAAPRGHPAAAGLPVMPDVPGYDLRPDPLDARTPAELVRALVRLRQWAGRPAFRDMARRCEPHVAYTTMYTALTSDALPSLRVVLAIVSACGADDLKPAFTTAWRMLELAEDLPRRRAGQPARGKLYPVPSRPAQPQRPPSPARLQSASGRSPDSAVSLSPD